MNSKMPKPMHELGDMARDENWVLSEDEVLRQWQNLGQEVSFVEGNAQLELPTTSSNRLCNLYLREIQKLGRMPFVESFLDDALRQDYTEFTANSAELEQFINSYTEELETGMDYSTKIALREYSNNGYKAMNQVLRGQWNYEILGKQTPEALAHAQELNERVHERISASPSPDINFTTYRGTDLNTFHGYGVNSIADLEGLEGQFFLESGFCSTSLLQDKSFGGNNYEGGSYDEHNVEIKYLVPKDSHECVGLFTRDLSRYPEEKEVLINSKSLSYISKVEIAPDRSSANLEMVLIPRSVYESQEKM